MTSIREAIQGRDLDTSLLLYTLIGRVSNVLCVSGDTCPSTPHPKAWKNPSLLQQLQTAEPSLNIQPDSCICLLCRKDVSSITDDSFSPRWRRNIDTVRQCYIPDCQNTDIKVTKQASLQDLITFFRKEMMTLHIIVWTTIQSRM